MCDQQSLSSACAYAQSDQSLCLLLEYSMSVKLLTEHHLEFLSLKGDYTGSSESTLVKIRHCWKSHVAAQLCGPLFLIHQLTFLQSGVILSIQFLLNHFSTCRFFLSQRKADNFGLFFDQLTMFLTNDSFQTICKYILI